MKFRINHILIISLIILISIFFTGQFVNNKNARTTSSLAREIHDLQRSVSLYENKEIYLRSIIKSKDRKLDIITKTYENKEIYLRSIIKSKDRKLDIITKANVTLTGYHPWSNGINSDGYPWKTATMTMPVAGRTCAISSELVRKGWLGKKIYIEGVGVFQAEDRMNIRLNGLRIDLCMGSLEEALTFGKKENILAINLN